VEDAAGVPVSDGYCLVEPERRRNRVGRWLVEKHKMYCSRNITILLWVLYVALGVLQLVASSHGR
jgi:hypothetical protein